MWEGGFKAVGFVHSPLLPIGTPQVSTALIHVSDWFPTLLNLAGGNVSAVPGLDGFDVFDAITGSASSPRTELLHNIDIFGGVGSHGYGDAAMRVEDMKLIVMKSTGQAAQSGKHYVAPGCPKDVCVQPAKPNRKECAADTVNTTMWLFNLTADPLELCNLAASPSHAPDLARILARLAHYNATAILVNYPADDPAADPEQRSGAERGSWGPWR